MGDLVLCFCSHCSDMEPRFCIKIMNYLLAVPIIALYGQAGLCYVTGAQPIMAAHNGLVNHIIAWLNPGVEIKPRSQSMNKLMVACCGMG